MNLATSYRGQPLVALILLIGGWVAVRAILWDVGTPNLIAHAPSRFAAHAGEDARVAPPARAASAEAPSPVVPASPSASPMQHVDVSPVARVRAAPRPQPPIAPAQRYLAPPLAKPVPSPAFSPVPSAPVPAHISAAHQMLWMAALARLPLPPSLLARPALPQRVSGRPSSPSDPRWSADGWLLLRRGGTASPAGGLAPATYGASQAGAVVRYRLAPQSAHRPALYLRGSAALNGSREREAAFGISARPVAGLPVALAAEARLNNQPGGTRLRPAAFAYTELPPVALPLRARAEIYGQAGYVGGNFASAFADGQVRIDRRVARIGRGELRAGGGAWGGAQKGASRLDLGPTATLGLPLGGTAGARLGVDWRFRVAGNAAPSSGPALTLSAGF